MVPSSVSGPPAHLALPLPPSGPRPCRTAQGLPAAEACVPVHGLMSHWQPSHPTSTITDPALRASGPPSGPPAASLLCPQGPRALCWHGLLSTAPAAFTATVTPVGTENRLEGKLSPLAGLRWLGGGSPLCCWGLGKADKEAGPGGGSGRLGPGAAHTPTNSGWGGRAGPRPRGGDINHRGAPVRVASGTKGKHLAKGQDLSPRAPGALGPTTARPGGGGRGRDIWGLGPGSPLCLGKGPRPGPLDCGREKEARREAGRWQVTAEEEEGTSLLLFPLREEPKAGSLPRAAS